MAKCRMFGGGGSVVIRIAWRLLKSDLNVLNFHLNAEGTVWWWLGDCRMRRIMYGVAFSYSGTFSE